jgi:hypothetical protein
VIEQESMVSPLTASTTNHTSRLGTNARPINMSSLSVTEVKPEFLLSESDDQLPTKIFSADECIAFILTQGRSEVDRKLAVYLKSALGFSNVFLL